MFFFQAQNMHKTWRKQCYLFPPKGTSYPKHSHGIWSWWLSNQRCILLTVYKGNTHRRSFPQMRKDCKCERKQRKITNVGTNTRINARECEERKRLMKTSPRIQCLGRSSSNSLRLMHSLSSRATNNKYAQITTRRDQEVVGSLWKTQWREYRWTEGVRAIT